MEKLFKKINFIIPISIVGVIWTILVLVLADYEKVKFMFWAGFGFGLFTFIATAAVSFLVRQKTNNTTIELSVIVYYSIAAYFIVSFLLNTIFVIVATSENKKLAIIPNVIIILIFFGALVVSSRYMQRVSQVGQQITTEVVSIQMIAVQIGSIIDMAEDPEIKEQLKKLKESVDFSDQVGVAATKDIEDQFRTLVFSIQTMVEETEPKDEILKKIKAANSTWKTRNSMLATLR